MEISTKELRRNPGRTLASVSRGQELVVTYRGKRIAKIVPFSPENDSSDDDEDLIFGLWRDHEGEDVDEYLRNLRRGRQF